MSRQRGVGETARPVIWHEEHGPDDAPLVVLVHGSMDRATGLAKLSRRLDDRFRVLRFDRRGYGRSVPHPGPFDVASQVDDVEALLSGRRALLFGHSFGGNVALAAAQRLGEQIEAVVVYESPLSWRDWWPGQASRAVVDGSGDPADLAEAFMRRLIGDERWERLPPRTRQQRRDEGPALVAELTALALSAPWDADRIFVPVVALAGEHGRPHHLAASRVLADEIAGASYSEVAGAGHFGPNTHPDDVAHHIAALHCSTDGRPGRPSTRP